MRFTVLLLPDEDPDLYVAFAPALDVVTQGGTVEEAMVTAHEAATLAVGSMIEDDEELFTERGIAILGTIEVDVPVTAAATA